MKNLPQPYKYKSFISYSRAADTQLAPALKTALQGFAKAWYKLRAVQIFCDQTNLTANPDLWASIERNLAASEYFIYLASPQAAQSKWVRKEINFFHEATGVDKMIIVLTDGEIIWDDAATDFNWQHTTAVPKLDTVLFTQEPVWIDMRWIRKDQLSARDPRFLDTIANLSSVLRNVDKDTLIGKDVEEHRKAKRFRLFSLTGLSLLAIFLIIATLLAVKSQKLSQERLVKTFNNNGIELLKSGDYALALPWFIEAMANEKNSDKKEIETYRIENLFNQFPKLSQVSQQQMPVLQTAFLSNNNVMIISGHSAGWWTNAYDCNDCSAELKVLDIETGKEAYQPIEIKDGIRQSAISNDKTFFASLSIQNVLRLWNINNGKLLWQQQLNMPVTKDIFHCGFDFNADNSKLLFYYENAISIYETMSGALINHLSQVSASIGEASFLKDGNTIIFSTGDLYRWQLNNTTASIIQLPYVEIILNFVLSADKTHIAIEGTKPNKDYNGSGYSELSMVACADINNIQQPLFIKTVESSTNNFKIEFDAHNHVLGINSSHTSEGGTGDDGTRVWDVLNGNPLSSWIKLPQEVALSLDSAGSKLAVTCRDATTEIWTIQTTGGMGVSKRLWRFRDGSQEVKSIFRADNKYLLTCGADNLVKLWKIPADDFIPLHLYNDLKGYEYYYEDNDAGTEFTAQYSNYYDKHVQKVDSSVIYIYDIKTKQRTGKSLQHNSQVYIANISADDNYVATAAFEEACMWNRKTQEKLYNFSFGKPAGVKHMVFSNDSKIILVVFTDYTCGVWDVKTGRPVTGFIKHPSEASIVDEASGSFSHDEKKIITSDNNMNWIWDAVSGEPLSAPVKVYWPTIDAALDSVVNKKRSDASKANTLLIQQLSLNDIRNYSALVAGGELDASSNFIPLSANDFMKRWEAWKTAVRK